jgi:putative Mg2+ transporter-C (MgtC) family protein
LISEQLLGELNQTTWLPLPVIITRLLLAVVLGAIVGFEREWQNRPAGLRTHILVCLAAATATVLTIEMLHLDVLQGEEVSIDPLRLVDSLTAGVAFLAAGMIVFTRGEVHGVTTGAGMWLAGIIGMGAGLGQWRIAVLATLLSLVILSFLRRFELRLLSKGEASYPPGKKSVD